MRKDGNLEEKINKWRWQGNFRERRILDVAKYVFWTRLPPRLNGHSIGKRMVRRRCVILMYRGNIWRFEATRILSSLDRSTKSLYGKYTYNTWMWPSAQIKGNEYARSPMSFNSCRIVLITTITSGTRIFMHMFVHHFEDAKMRIICKNEDAKLKCNNERVEHTIHDFAKWNL